MNKKGFTLVEVLAVIIILGIIGAIIYPKIANTINNSEDNTYMLSTQGLVESLNSYVMDKKATLTPFSGCTYNFDTNVSDCDGFSYNGNLPTGGRINVDSDGNVNGYVTFSNKDDKYVINNNKVGVNTPVSLEIVTLPYKLRYNVGESLDLTGMVIRASYSDGSVVDISDYDISTLDSSSVGTKVIKINYDLLEVSFEVEVVDMIYLYENGNYASITGGWKTPMGKRTSSWTNYSAAFMSDYIQLEQKENSSNWWMSSVYTGSQIDFSKYSKLGIMYENEAKIDYTISTQIGTSTSFEYEDSTFTKSLNSSEGVHTSLIDLSGLSSGYLKIYVVSYNTTVDSVVKIKKVWVEY